MAPYEPHNKRDMSMTWFSGTDTARATIYNSSAFDDMVLREAKRAAEEMERREKKAAERRKLEEMMLSGINSFRWEKGPNWVDAPSMCQQASISPVQELARNPNHTPKEQLFCYRHQQELPDYKRKLIEYKNKFKPIPPITKSYHIDNGCLACRLEIKK